MDRSTKNTPFAEKKASTRTPSPSLMLPLRPEPIRLPRSRAGSVASSKPSPFNPATSTTDSNKPSPLIKSDLAPASSDKTDDIKDAEGAENIYNAQPVKEVDNNGDESAEASPSKAGHRNRDSVMLTLARTETAGGTQWEGLYNELDGKYLGDIQQKVPKEDVPMQDHLAGLLRAEDEVEHAHEVEEAEKHITDKNEKVEEAMEDLGNSEEYEMARKALLENPPKEPVPEPLTLEQLNYHAQMVETVRQKLEEIPIPFGGLSPSNEIKSFDDGLTSEEQKVKENIPLGENKPKENTATADGRLRGVGL